MNENNNSLVRTTPVDFFLQIGVFATLIVSAVSFITLLFTLIERLFPDPLTMRYVYNIASYTGPMRAAIASLIIIFPTYLLLSRYINRDYVRSPEKKEFAIRKWVIYLTLFVSGATVLIDLVTLLTRFLGGELTSQFALKVIAILAVAGIIFSYYFYELRRTEIVAPKRRMFAWTSIVVVIAALIGGFAIMGSPKSQRLMQFDTQKVNDLQNLQSQLVYTYWSQKGELPDTLNALKDDISYGHVPVDPQTGEAYGYEKIGDLQFKLCAAFNLSSEEQYDRAVARPSMVYPDGGYLKDEKWDHPAGDHCFTRTIDPELIPKR